MGSIWMWIVLGAFVGIFFIYIIIATLLDRKKTKFKDNLKNKNNHKQIIYGKIVIGTIWEVYKLNKLNLKKFVPSISKKSMGDIKNYAKSILKNLKREKAYIEAKKNSQNKGIIDFIIRLEKNNSNQWFALKIEFENFNNALKIYLKSVEKKEADLIKNETKKLFKKIKI